MSPTWPSLALPLHGISTQVAISTLVLKYTNPRSVHYTVALLEVHQTLVLKYSCSSGKGLLNLLENPFLEMALVVLI